MKEFLGLLFFIAIVFGMYSAGYSDARHFYEKEAVEHNFAEYNSKTGEWQWKETDISAEDSEREQDVEP